MHTTLIDLLKTFPKDVGLHVCIMREPYLGMLFDGTKTIESRFSKNRIAPYEAVNSGDVVLLKRAGGKIHGYFIAGSITYSDDGQLWHIRKKHEAAICGTSEFWEKQAGRKYATLITVAEIHRVAKKIPFYKTDMRGWVVIRKGKQEPKPTPQLNLFKQ